MALPDNLRDFSDHKTTRKWLMEDTLSSLGKRFPIEDKDYRLELGNIRPEGPQEFGMGRQKNALMRDEQLRIPIKGTWKLTHKASGQVLDEKDDTVMHLPYLTDRGTMLYGGNEYSAANQARLRAGVYARRKKSGEIESFYNVKAGTGRSFRVWLEPQTGVFKVNIGQSNIPLYPLMQAMGVKDVDLNKAWGGEILAANAAARSQQAIEKLYERFTRKLPSAELSDQGRRDELSKSVNSAEVDPDVVTRTLGLAGHKNVSSDMLIRSTQKMLNIAKGQEDPDDRDAPMFSRVLGIEDHIKERIDNDAGRIARTLIWKVRRDRNLRRVPVGALNPYVEGYLLGSRLTMPLEETNPMALLEQSSRITKMGEGGIGSEQAVTDEARNVNIGQLGFIDPISGPESGSIGIDVRASYRTFKGRDQQMYAEFKDTKSGKLKYLRPDDVDGKVIAFPGEFKKDTTPDSIVTVVKGGKIQEVPASEVDLEVPSFAHMMSANTNLNPMPTAVQAARQFYGAKFWTQYMPQAQGDVPYVDSLTPDGNETFSEHYGKKMGSITADYTGQVVKVTDDMIVTRDAKGQKHEVELVKDFPFNRLSAITYTSAVKVGDAVEPGKILASSNFTDAKTGSLKLGRNLSIAIVPFRGESYEDAVVISASAAKKLTTQRLYGYDTEAKHGVELDKGKYVSLFPAIFGQKQLVNLDDDGIVKAGTTLNKGDPIILAVGPKLLTPEDVQLGKLHKALRNAHTDKSTVWEHDYPGIVTDAARTRNGAKVNIKSEVPVQQGDKLSGRFGLKGVVGCYDDQTEVFTDHGWIPWPDITNEYRLACLINGKGEFHYPTTLIVSDYIGTMITGSNNQLDYCVTPNHRMYCRIGHYRGKRARYSIRTADTIERKNIYHLCAAPFTWESKSSDTFNLCDYVAYDPIHERKKSKVNFASADVAEFMGWYLAEGNVASYEGFGIGCKGNHVTSYKVQLAQSRFINPVKCARIETLLTRMGLCWHYGRGSNIQYTFSSKPWYMLLKPLGLSGDKCFPSWVWQMAPHALQHMFDALIDGDGCRVHCKTCRDTLTYKSKSLALCNDVARLATLLGYNARVSPASADAHAQRWVVYCKSKTELGQASAKFTRKAYNGKVYCAQVPGGLVYVRRFGRPMWCGNSVVDDDKMPRDAATNKPYDMLLNPLGVLSRVAAGQLMEAQLGKLAERTGKQVRLPQLPPEEGWNSWTMKQLEAAGIPEKESVFDPELGRVINKPVATGNMYVMAFHHLSEKKLSERGAGGLSYTMDELPSRGGGDTQQAKKMSSMDVNQLLAHGANDVIHDSMVIRGARNDEYWKALKLGRPLPEPNVPFVYNKFLNLLKAGGINISQKGDILQLMPMTDKDVTTLSHGAVETSAMLDDKFEPIKGGLFDSGRTGGAVGKFWTHVALNAPMPNPIFEEPIRRLLGLRQKDFVDIVAGKQELNGKTGGEAIQSALKGLDIDTEIAKHKENIQRLRGSNRDNAVKAVGYLSAAKKQGIHPADWVLNKVPVLPPVFRPISRLGDLTLESDLNELYRDLVEVNNNIGELRQSMPDSTLHEEKAKLYTALSAVVGLGDPITAEGKSKRLSGAVRTVIGTSPKHGFFQSRVIAKPMDMVGRAVVTPDPSMDMDHVGIPEQSAWNLYKNFVTRRLVQQNIPAHKALEMIEKRDPQARDALDVEMANRPVIIDRAPTWHKFNILAAYPHITKGDTMTVSPLISKGFTLDHDGDQMNFHVPASDKAVAQAKARMLPSKNLFSLTDLHTVRHSPQQELALGLYMLTRKASAKPVRRFASASEAKRAYNAGQIDANDPIEIVG